MRVVLGGDHRGYELKDILIAHLKERGHTAIDVGTNSPESVDYPDISQAVCEAVLAGDADRGIIVCGSGVGACVAANKIAGIRAAITHDTYSAHQGVEHDDMNVICLGSHVIGAGRGDRDRRRVHRREVPHGGALRPAPEQGEGAGERRSERPEAPGQEERYDATRCKSWPSTARASGTTT